MKHNKITLSVSALAILGLAACGSIQKSAVPVELVNENLFERLEIDVVQTAETLEIPLNQAASQLTLADKHLIKEFVRSYNEYGHGPMVMLLPENTPNQQFAVGAVAEARAIAFENGVEYEEIAGGSKFGPYPIMTLTFQAFDAVAPECKGFGEVDISATRSNNDLPNLGCSVRTNLAAMIVDPADFLGQRELDPGDTLRRHLVFDRFRNGEATGSQRNAGESGAISDVAG